MKTDSKIQFPDQESIPLQIFLVGISLFLRYNGLLQHWIDFLKSIKRWTSKNNALEDTIGYSSLVLIVNAISAYYYFFTTGLSDFFVWFFLPLIVYFCLYLPATLKIRSILNDHYVKNLKLNIHFNRLPTLLFGAFYLQSQINKMHEQFKDEKVWYSEPEIELDEDVAIDLVQKGGIEIVPENELVWYKKYYIERIANYFNLYMETIETLTTKINEFKYANLSSDLLRFNENIDLFHSISEEIANQTANFFENDTIRYSTLKMFEKALLKKLDSAKIILIKHIAALQELPEKIEKIINHHDELLVNSAFETINEHQSILSKEIDEQRNLFTQNIQDLQEQVQSVYQSLDQRH